MYLSPFVMTPFIKKKEIKKEWYLINAENAAVGRLASYISKVLRGKNKSTYNPHIDNGDYVVVTNIDKIKFTGKKFKKKNILDIQVILEVLKRPHLYYSKKKIKHMKY